jgi:hypothetical protein
MVNGFSNPVSKINKVERDILNGSVKIPGLIYNKTREAKGLTPPTPRSARCVETNLKTVVQSVVMVMPPSLYHVLPPKRHSPLKLKKRTQNSASCAEDTVSPNGIRYSSATDAQMASTTVVRTKFSYPFLRVPVA